MGRKALSKIVGIEKIENSKIYQNILQKSGHKYEFCSPCPADHFAPITFGQGCNKGLNEHLTES